MMIHSWDTEANIVKIVDNNSGEEYFIDSFAYTINNRWNKHGDMCVQYAECLKRNIKDKTLRKNEIVFDLLSSKINL